MELVCLSGVFWAVPSRPDRRCVMQFADGSFSAAVDKGGLDALMGEDTEGSEAAGTKLLAEVARLLKSRKGSVYICVTLAQAHVLSRLLLSAPKAHSIRPLSLMLCASCRAWV